MKELYIKQIHLKDYRNFANFKIETQNTPIILTGKNGVGKTNILESISLIFPGRGIRGSKFQEIARNNKHNFIAKYIFESKLGTSEIINNFNFAENKRLIQFNGSTIPANDLNKLTSIIWLTPQMNGIFLEAPKVRRRFLDRIVYNFDSAHATFISKYEYYIHERIKLLRSDNVYTNLLNEYEQKIADYSFAIIKARSKVLDMLQRSLDIITEFPRVILKTDGELEQTIGKAVEQNFRLDTKNEITIIMDMLNSRRELDKITGKTSIGPHKSDFLITYAKNGILAKHCSTGQQKAMLLSILIAQIDLCIKEQQVKPIVLLDEVFASLDQTRKDYLIEYFSTVNLQFWLTATDLNGIHGLMNYAQHLDLDTISHNEVIEL